MQDSFRQGNFDTSGELVPILPIDIIRDFE